VDTYIRAGGYGARAFPFTPGSDAAGEVAAVGVGVTQFEIGDRVYLTGAIDGTYSQKAIALESHVFALPEHVSFEQGAALGIPYGTAYRALVIRGEARAGETLLVHGASGGVGLACVQIARILGLKTIGTASTDEGRKRVLEQGAHHVFNHSASAYLEQILKLTGGRGLDLIAEMLANVNLQRDLTVLSKRGRIVIIGSRGRVEIDPRELMTRDADIRGMSLAHSDGVELADIHRFINTGLKNRTLWPIVGTTLPLAEASRAHEAIVTGGKSGKIILLP
jgi:NADPH2:quinone reductase